MEQRVDLMIEAGLLNEVYDIYNLNADYTRGMRQAIGVREFEDFLCANNSEVQKDKNNSSQESDSVKNADTSLGQNWKELLSSSSDTPDRLLLEEAISKLKVNTRRLVRKQVIFLSPPSLLFICFFIFFMMDDWVRGTLKSPP